MALGPHSEAEKSERGKLRGAGFREKVSGAVIAGWACTDPRGLQGALRPKFGHALCLQPRTRRWE